MSYLQLKEKGTSVKSIGVIIHPTETEPGICDFIYRDQYSVFDWGKMPIPEGAVMDNRPVALVAAFNHEKLAKMRIPTTYIGAVCEEGHVEDMDWFKENRKLPAALRMEMVNIIKPEFKDGKWDYSKFQNPEMNNYVHPIEFIWRKEAGPDASFWKNIAKGLYKLSDFGLPETLKAGDKFPSPVLDHSSKYEDHDRYFSPAEAQKLAAIPNSRWQTLDSMRQMINATLTEHAAQIRIYRPDGKQEFCLVTEGRTAEDKLGDVAGTWHEDRFEYTTESGIVVKVSKQTPRDFNKLLNPKWAQQCDEAKIYAEEQGLPDWKLFVTERPKPLEAAFFREYNNLMRSATNAWVGWNAFPEASPLEEACREFDKYSKDYKERIKRAG